MKKMLKTVGELLLDQFIGVISACMLPLCVKSIFDNSKLGFVVAFCICFGLYSYAAYLTAFKSGFRDLNRVKKSSTYYGYLYKGALVGFLSAIPLLIAVVIYFFVTKQAHLIVYFMNMYWVWPLKMIFPNHVNLIVVLAFVPMIVIPWIAYIAGYKNFTVSELIVKLFKKITIASTVEKK